MAADTKAILLVADISGFTKFMKLHAISTSHAKQIIVRLLKTLMKTSKPPLKVAELEGDAVFFYALSSKEDLKKTAEKVKAQVIEFFSTFNKELAILSKMHACVCDACTRVSDLKLKQVIHEGEVEIEKIAQFEKLFGLDVIVVHRMLKNSVPSHEYVMMTHPVFKSFVDFYGLNPEHRTEDFEGVGNVETLVFYPSEAVGKVQTKEVKPSLREKLSWVFKVVPYTFVDLFGFGKPKAEFKNLPA
jgi:hypothetical protein